MKKLGKSFLMNFLVLMFLTTYFLPTTAKAMPPLPTDLQMVEPDSSISAELRDLWGKWEGLYNFGGLIFPVYYIIEKIDAQQASLYIYSRSWDKYVASVTVERGKYKIWWHTRQSGTLKAFVNKGEMIVEGSGGTLHLKLVK
jgi:hypothetical protein